MQVNPKIKKALSLLLVLSMVLQYVPMAGFAADVDNFCEHHPEHTAECGYTEGVAGQPCTHLCEDACAEGCLHAEHDEFCGYAEEVAASPCCYECDECNSEGTETPTEATEPSEEPTEPVTEATEQPGEELGQINSDEVTFEPMDAVAEAPDEEDDPIGSGTPDGTPPVLHGVTISATTVTVPGELEVIVDASDDVSGVSSVNVRFRCEETGKDLTVYPNAGYYDSEQEKFVTYEDGRFHGTLKIDQYVESGRFHLYDVYIKDIAGNYITYYGNKLPEAIDNLYFDVIESDTPDGTPPVLNGVSINKTSVNAPGKLEVIVDISDDISGVSSVNVCFRCEETGKDLTVYPNAGYYDPEKEKFVTYEDGRFHGTLEIDQYVESGRFHLYDVYIRDIAGNSITYYGNKLPEAIDNLYFDVIESDTPDGTPPVLNGVSINKTSVNAPGKLEVIVDISDDISGVSSVNVRFRCEETGKDLTVYPNAGYYDPEQEKFVTYEDGRFHGTLKIDQYVESGRFHLYNVYIRDIAGNSITYYGNKLPDSVKSIEFKVFNTIPDVTTSVSNSNFVDILDNAANNAYIAADYSGDATMTKEAFEAIAGTDKTVDLISEGITWRFEGNDITEEIKDIDLKVEIQRVENDNSSSGNAIEEELNGNPGVVMKFPENGTLPGKATIQVKVDYAMREYLGTGNVLCVYYYNNQTGELELIAENLTIIDDTYVEFPITHCSYYVLAPKLPEKVLDSGTCGTNLTWELTSDGTLTISGTGDMNSYVSTGWGTTIKDRPWNWYLDQITDVVLPEGLTSIGAGAFAKMTAVRSIVIPSTVKNIGAHAFYQSSGLQEIFFTGDPPYFPSGSGFMGSSSSDYIFDGVTATAYYPAGNAAWTEDVMLNYGGTITWALYRNDLEGSCGDNLEWAFNKQNGTLVLYGSGEMADYADRDIPWIQYADQITEVILPKEITSIGSGAFRNLTKLKKVVMPESVAQIGDNAFSQCVDLKVINFNGNAPVIGDDAFAGVTTFVVYPVDNDPWPEDVQKDYGGNITWMPYEGTCGANLYWYFEEETGTVHIVGYGAMNSASNPREVPWRQYEDRITHVDLADGLTSIGLYAFFGLNKLNAIVIPASVQSINNYAFKGCKGLQSITFLGNAPDFGWYSGSMSETFSGVTAIAYYPADNATWTEYVMLDYGGTIIWLATGSDAKGTCGDDLTWVFDERNSALTIFGTGDMHDFSDHDTPWKQYADQIANVILCEGITHIGNGAFQDLTMLNSIQIPDSVLTIGQQAFGGCTALGEVMLSQNLTVIESGSFAGCAALESIRLPESVVRIGDDAFSQCSKLKEITFTGNAPEIEENAFSGVTASAWYPADNESWNVDVQKDYGGSFTWMLYEGTCGKKLYWYFEAENGTLYIAGSGGMNGYYTSGWGGIIIDVPWKQYLDQITNVILPEGLTSIGAGAFANMTALRSIVIPGTVQRIETYAFCYSYGLQEITFMGNPPTFESFKGGGFKQYSIFNGVTAIAYYPAENETWTEEVMLDYGGTIIWLADGSGVKGTCGDDLTWVFDEHNSTLTIFGTGDMYDFADNDMPWKQYADQITNVILYDGITRIGNSAFWGFSKLETIRIPESVLSIGRQAFNRCTMLSEVELPYNLMVIESGCFEYCRRLSEIMLPDCLTEIGSRAFSQTALTNIFFNGNAPQIGDMAFWGNTADVAYPAYDESWTEDVRKNYGGDLTWLIYNGDCGDSLYWGFDETTGTLNIFGDGGEMWDTPWSQYADQITNVNLCSGLYSIGSYAFAELTELRSIVIPYHVQYIGEYAFYNCSSLEQITFLGNAPTFECYDDYTNFSGITATVYYQAKGTNWPEDALQDYGGKITWVKLDSQAQSIALSMFETDVFVGQTVSLRAEITPEDSIVNLIYTFDDLVEVVNYAGFDQSQVNLKAVKPGTTTITVEDTVSGSTGSISFTVKAPVILTCPYEGELDAAGACLYEFTPTESGRYMLAVDGVFNHLVADPEIGMYGSGGNDGIRSMNENSVSYTVTLEAGTTYFFRVSGSNSNSLNAKLRLNKVESVSGIDIPREKMTLWLTESGYWSTKEIYANFLPANAMGQITWTSSNPEVISVENSTEVAGTMYLHKPGTAVVTATCGNYTDSVEVTVKYAPELTLGVPMRNTYDQGIGKWFKFTAETEGTYIFSAQSDADLELYVDEYSSNDYEGNILKHMFAGETAYFAVYGRYPRPANEEYTVRIDKAGIASAVDMAVELSGSTNTLMVNPVFEPEFAIDPVVKWSVSNETILRVNEETPYHAYYKIVGSGTVTISITTEGGLTANRTVHIGNCGDNIKWILDENGTLTIDGIGAMWNLSDGAPWDEWKLEINRVLVQYRVTEIGQCAFDGMTNLTEVELPENLRIIGNEAFGQCSSLKNITFCGNAPAFGADAFADVAATIYYPATNDMWDDVVGEQFGGTLTWVPYCVGEHAFENGTCKNCGENQPGPIIMKQPETVEVSMGEYYCVTVEAEGEGLKYQWYFRNAGSSTWNKSNIRDNTYDDVMNTTRAGREIYCVITDIDGYSVTTETVKLICIPATKLEIITQPTDSKVKLGERYCVTVEATGEGLKYQWYFRNAGSDVWYRSSVTDNTYDDIMTEARNNREIYCVIADAYGNKVTTEVVKLIAASTVELKLLKQPSDAYASMGEQYCVTVEAEGEGLKYQWYFCNAGSDKWYKSSITDNTYDDVMNKIRAGREVYCVITDALGNKVTTDVAKLVLIE